MKSWGLNSKSLGTREKPVKKSGMMGGGKMTKMGKGAKPGMVKTPMATGKATHK